MSKSGRQLKMLRKIKIWTTTKFLPSYGKLVPSLLFYDTSICKGWTSVVTETLSVFELTKEMVTR